MCELADIRCRYECLQTEWDYQQEHISRIEEELASLQLQLQHQSQFCAALGAVLGNLVWKASREPKFVDTLLESDQLNELLTIVNGTLMSYMETYSVEMPAPCADETQFVLSLVGIVANMASCPGGRLYMSGSEVARELLTQFIQVLPAVPVPSGDPLRKLIYMALYNISINQKGLRFLQDQGDELMPVLGTSVNCDSTPEPRLMGLRLLASLTFDVASPMVLEDLDGVVPLDDIQRLSMGGVDDATREACHDVLSNVERARQKFGLSIGGRCPGGVEYKQCQFVRAQGDLRPCNVPAVP